MVFTIKTYYNPVRSHVRRHLVFTITTCKPVRRHLYGVYHHNLLEGTSMVFTIITYYNPVRRHLYGVYHHQYYKPVRRHLYGVYHHNLLEGTSMVFTIIT